MTAFYLMKLTRRSTLQWLSAATLAAAIPRYAASSSGTVGTVTYEPSSHGYGTDPELLHPTVPWKRILTQHQLQLTAVLADLILPGTSDAPAPSAIGIPEFVDEWVSAPYPDQRQDREVILGGFKWADAEALHGSGGGFLELEAPHREAIVNTMAHPDGGALAAQHVFFRRLRSIVVGAYYSTPEGFKDIGYTGNVPLLAYPPITETERVILEERLAKLGLPQD